ncbi:MAG: patatin-like phospholipase family protein [Magnetococcales bacterium]|nr:patatin-like phospholipase family protein [Magnetococcales bacterium]
MDPQTAAHNTTSPTIHSAQVFDDEKKKLEVSDDEPLVGLGLSGGGIRSASFNLGVIQALEEKGWMKKIHYLSTVSGGGYIGSAYSWFAYCNSKFREEIKKNLKDFSDYTDKNSTKEKKLISCVRAIEKNYTQDTLFRIKDDNDTIIINSINNNLKLLENGKSSNKELLNRTVKDIQTLLEKIDALNHAPPPVFAQKATPLNHISRRRINWIRSRGNFLTPTPGLNTWTLLAANLRGIFINLLILFPTIWLVSLVLSTPAHDIFDNKNLNINSSYKLRFFQCQDNKEIQTKTICNVEQWQKQCLETQNCNQNDTYLKQSNLLVVADLILYLGIWITLIIGVLGSLLYAFFSIDLPDIANKMKALLGKISLNNKNSATSVQLKKSPARFSIHTHTTRLWVNRWSGKALWFVLALLTLGTLPFMEQLVQHWFKTASFAGLAGAIGVAAGWFQRRNNNEGQGWQSHAIAIGSTLLIYALVLWLYHEALMIQSIKTTPAAHSPIQDDFGNYLYVFFTLLLSTVLGFWANINHVSMHRFYRDRLREAFMPSNNQSELETFCPSIPSNKADEFALYDLSQRTPAKPYHLINTTMNTSTSKNPKWAGRGGQNFIFSPLYCGSDATGYQSTKTFADGQFSLATAFTISGAAVDPNTGITRFGPLAFLMALLNIRLGYWCVNPNPKFNPKRYNKPSTPSWLPSIWNEMFQQNLDEEQEFIHLADGGHFENLAAYELIRRRCKVIIIGDAGADPGNTFDTLGNLVQKVRVDFEVEITIDTAPMRPDDKPEEEQKSRQTSAGKKLCDTPYLVGTIAYPEIKQDKMTVAQTTGYLIYINTCLFDDLPQCVWTYQRMNKEFPEQTTADQFFDEAQFEAYRELGYHALQRMIKDVHDGASPEQTQEPEQTQTSAKAWSVTPEQRKRLIEIYKIISA